MSNLAAAYQDAGRLADALPLFEETLRRRQATRGPDHPQTLRSMNNLARAYLVDQPRPGRAAPAARPWRSARRSSPTTGAPSRPESLLGASLLGQKKYAEAEPHPAPRL